MNYQSLFSLQSPQLIFSQMQQTVHHQVALCDDVMLLKIQENGSLNLELHDDQALQEKKIIKYHILLEKNAQLKFFINLMYAQDVQIEIHLYLQGDGAQADIFGVYALDQKQKCCINTYQMHYGIQTKSSLMLHGMLKDQAQANILGLIFIDQCASKTDASQENKNIVLGKQARVVSIPSIEVLNHDVQCCHGTAVGQFDKQHAWYLQSRGFDHVSLHQMLVQSFFGQVVQKFENRFELMEKLCKKMI